MFEPRHGSSFRAGAVGYRTVAEARAEASEGSSCAPRPYRCRSALAVGGKVSEVLLELLWGQPARSEMIQQPAGMRVQSLCET